MHDIYLSIISIIDLINKLEINGIIRSYNKTELPDKIEIGYSETISLMEKGSDSDINQKFIEYIEKGIITDIQLIKFKKSKYNTFEELKYIRERITIWVGIIIAVITSIATNVIQYLKN